MVAIGSVTSAEASRLASGIGEVDRVLGGGFVPGSIILFGGDPGIGKSTLLLQLAARIAGRDGTGVLYITGEESAAQVRGRAERIDAVVDGLSLVATTDLEAALAGDRDRGAGPRGDRQRPDHDERRAHRARGQRGTGPRGRGAPRRGGEGQRDVRRARRPRDEGGDGGRPADPRAPRRRGDLPRGRAPGDDAAAARREEPLRIHGRGGRARDARGRPGGGRGREPILHRVGRGADGRVRGDDRAGGHAPARGRDPGALGAGELWVAAARDDGDRGEPRADAHRGPGAARRPQPHRARRLRERGRRPADRRAGGRPRRGHRTRLEPAGAPSSGRDGARGRGRAVRAAARSGARRAASSRGATPRLRAPRHGPVARVDRPRRGRRPRRRARHHGRRFSSRSTADRSGRSARRSSHARDMETGGIACYCRGKRDNRTSSPFIRRPTRVEFIRGLIGS